ncbi:hypothetical protein AC579_841 [Pseudocercospora musae]|uniref:Cytochrome P450 n=1 Tax=Pseudocercospora musae TaxID=113226 RepID=A0A139IIM4_9PEZI|nr:hypothetical protein AC579_841 [Pseudocercospora musae]
MLELHIKLVATAICAITLAYSGRFFYIGYRIRKRHKTLPGPPHSWILGNLRVMGEVAMSLPRRVHPHVFPTFVRRKHQLRSFFYVDVWPFGDPFIAVMDPDICQQFSVEYQTLKHPSLKTFIEPLCGKDDMVSSDGAKWKKWRSMFNPGFSTQNLTTVVPGIVDDCLIYCEILSERANTQHIFRLEEASTRLTIDIIGRVVLDLHFNMQRGDDECIQALREQVHLLPNEDQGTNPLRMWRPYGIYRRWKNDKLMKEYLGKLVDDRFASMDIASTNKQRRKTVLDLALDSYLSNDIDLETGGTSPKPKALDKTFKEGAITQIRICLFAGHDTTSSTICYALYLLGKNPGILHRLRLEHEKILGPISQSASKIKEDPYALNKLEYTTCIIKEVLRLFPAASAPRKGQKGLLLHDRKTGEKYPTEGYMIWMIHYGLGHNPEVWGFDHDIFNPDRFLPENAHKIPEGAFRSFEVGARSCLGQNLAILETKIILALICRKFEFDLRLDKEGLEAVGKDGSFYAKEKTSRMGKQDVEGEELYQILVGAAKPREGMPVQVREVEWTAEEDKSSF